MKLLPLIIISEGNVLEKDCPRTNGNATSRLLHDVSPKRFNRLKLENRNDRQNSKEARDNAFTIIAIFCVHLSGLRALNMS